MTLEELEKKFRALEDLEEIKQLQRQYMWWFHNNQWDEIIDCFTENATVEIRQSGLRKGKKEIAELYKSGKKKGVEEAHFVGQPIISIEGDRAKGHWNVCILFPEPSIQWVQGRNDCEYVRENGKWKFSSLKFTRILGSQTSLYP
jgi:hypothetical protein